MIHAIPLFQFGAMVASEHYEYRRKMRTGRIIDPRIELVQRRGIRRTGKLNQPEKREPLPVGLYWIDVFGTGKIQLFQAWLSIHADTVKVRTTEVYDNSGTASPWGDIFDIPLIDNPPNGVWTLFEVLQPTTWALAPSLGWPQTADNSIKSSGDTIQSPPPPKSVFDEIAEGGWPTWLPWAIGGGLAIVVLAVVVRR